MTHPPKTHSISRTVKRRSKTVVFFERAAMRVSPAASPLSANNHLPRSASADGDEVLLKLRKQFPDSIGAGRPLAIGAGDDLITQADSLGVSGKQLKAALRYLTNTTHYLEAVMAEDSFRVDLAGKWVSDVTDAQRQHAQSKLAAITERRRKHETPGRR